MKTKLTHKAVTAVIVATVLVVMSAVAVFAYLRWGSAGVTNTFTPDEEATPTVEETFDTNNNLKQNVSINVGNNAATIGDTGYSVYVRAAIVVTWVNPDTKAVYVTAPVRGEDYEISLYIKTDTDSTPKWFDCDDSFYYYEDAVASGGKTDVLIKSCKPLDEAPAEGYVLNVSIISQTIQALGKTDTTEIPAVEDAWGVVTVDDGKLVPNTSN